MKATGAGVSNGGAAAMAGHVSAVAKNPKSNALGFMIENHSYVNGGHVPSRGPES
ncbi:MAG TPA: hypothetical protein VIR62_11130 [Allosphingosinicella sp.]